MVIIAILFQIPILGLIQSCFSFWVIPWLTEFESPRAPVVLGATGMLAVGALIAPFVGRALDRWSISSIMTIGLIFYAVGFLILAIARELWIVIAVYGITSGVGFSLIGPLATQTLTARWFRT